MGQLAQEHLGQVETEWVGQNTPESTFNREKIKEAGNFRYYQGYFSFYALIPAPSFAIKGGPETWFNLGKEIKRLAVVS